METEIQTGDSAHSNEASYTNHQDDSEITEVFNNDDDNLDSRSVVSNLSNYTVSDTTDVFPKTDITFIHFSKTHLPSYTIHVMHKENKSSDPAHVAKLIISSYPNGISKFVISEFLI